MFLKNAWYCAGWDESISQGKDSVVHRKIAGQDLVLYRKPDGQVVALEDRCPHRQAPLSMGQKEGDSIRCMYHGLKFAPDGKCTEVPGQDHIPEKACVRVYPVIEKNNWIWVWMGEKEKADPDLICFSVGPGHPDWNIKPAQIRVNADYRLEIANLMDLSHLTWVHKDTFGGTDAYSKQPVQVEMRQRGVYRNFWMYSVPAPKFLQHLMPPGALFDLHFDVEMTFPCNFILHFRAFTAGTVNDGPSNGHMILDSYSCQAITPADSETVDYYYSWGVSKATDSPGMSDLLHEAIIEAFIEDKEIVEGQHQRMKTASAGFQMIDIRHDMGPGKMLWLLDKLLKEESSQMAQSALVA